MTRNELIRTQAYICWVATKALTGPDLGQPNEFILRHIAGTIFDGDWATHKYLSEGLKESIEQMMESRPGAGVYGYWFFKDGSKIVCLCGSKYALVDKKYDIHKLNPE